MTIRDISEEHFIRIERLSQNRLKGTVSVFEIARWLSNFKSDEYHVALNVLDALDVYTEKELVELWNDRLTTLLEEKGESAKILINPIEEFGKSGTMMTYYIKKTPIYINNIERISFLENPSQLKQSLKSKKIDKDHVIVLIDDFAGSGKSVLTHYQHFIKQQISRYSITSRIVCVTLFSLHEAQSLLTKKAPELRLITETKNKAFSKRGSVFGYYQKTVELREFCFKYGVNLLTLRNRETGKDEDFPLGFDNSQALIIFPYNPPNNTLPIIWSSKRGHIPLYPRTPQYKIQDAKKYRKNLAFYISLLKHSEFSETFRSGQRKNDKSTFHYTTQTDFRVFGVLFLKRQKRPKITICQILGITDSDYNSIIKSLIENDFLTKEENFTEYGESIYFEVLAALRRERRKLRNVKSDYEVKQINYLPKQFKGKSFDN